MTEIDNVIASAQSEFGKHREAIESISAEVQRHRDTISGVIAGIRIELDDIKHDVANAQQAVGSSGGQSSVATGPLRAELDGLRAEIPNL